jgi:nucleoside-diphosphate-sugar epimerase
MRVMVSGATGFVGSHTAAALLAAGHEVVALVRDAGKLERVFLARGLKPPEAVVGDVREAAAVERAFSGCGAVIHAAAVVAVEAYRAREVLDSNARGFENVVGGALRAGVPRVVHVSSVAALFRPGGPRVTADSLVVPGRNAYSKSKADAERVARGLQAQDAPLRIAYPVGIVGPDDPGLSQANHALRTFVRDVVVLTSGGIAIVDVRDVAAILAELALRESAPARCVLAGHDLSWREVADALDAVTGRRVRRVPVPGALLRLGGHVCDAVKRVWDFDFPMTAEGMVLATLWQGADDSAARSALGARYRPLSETLSDALRWMQRAGHLDARSIGRLAEEAS